MDRNILYFLPFQLFILLFLHILVYIASLALYFYSMLGVLPMAFRALFPVRTEIIVNDNLLEHVSCFTLQKY
jgi:hypothetical protein